MSSVFKAALQREDARGKKRANAEDDEGHAQLKPRRNKQRVLILPSRGVTSRMRHLINDIETLLPHSKKGAPHAAAAAHSQTQNLTPSPICRR